jgi:D-alanyl-D-alanine carboxypeptidase/D-alanyl-D-alanine carboxypeptidase (penicillin-binding protein 5/6)
VLSTKIHRKILASILTVFFASPVVCAQAKKQTNYKSDASSIPSISAESAVLIESGTKTILFKKNERQERPIASTTKIMTSLLTLEASEQDDKNVTITDKMIPVEGSSMNLEVGNVLPLTSLAKGMMTVSGNDAAHSAAIFLSGSLPEFSNLMNKKAKEIGMNNTVFVTPSGLDKEDHHSTAYDMALLGAHAMNNPAFFDIVSKPISDVPFVLPKEVRKIKNKNRLLKMCKGCVGVKTGFTTLAGRCLVSCVERGGIRLIAVTLKASDDWRDHIKLYEYGFSCVEHVSLDKIKPLSMPVVGGKIDKIMLYQENLAHAVIEKGCSESVKAVVRVPNFVYAPVEKDQTIGNVDYLLEDKIVASQELLSRDNAPFAEVNRNILYMLFGWIFDRS